MAGGAPVVVQVGRAGTRLGEAAALGAARAAFAARHLAPLPSLFDPELLGELARHVEAARFERRVHYLTPQPVSDLWVRDQAVASRFAFLLNDPRLFAAVRDITGCDDIGCFHAVIYAMHPGDPPIDDWHDDVDGNRLVALSVSLGRAPHAGGALRVRDAASGALVAAERLERFGDGLLMRIDPRIQHSVSAVSGAPRVVMTGWFQRTPDYPTLLHG